MIKVIKLQHLYSRLIAVLSAIRGERGIMYKIGNQYIWKVKGTKYFCEQIGDVFVLGDVQGKIGSYKTLTGARLYTLRINGVKTHD